MAVFGRIDGDYVTEPAPGGTSSPAPAAPAGGKAGKGAKAGKGGEAGGGGSVGGSQPKAKKKEVAAAAQV